jgi:RNA polymerase sigma-54 factor
VHETTVSRAIANKYIKHAARGLRVQVFLHPRLPGRQRRRRFQHQRQGDDRRPDQHGGQGHSPQRPGDRRKLQEKGITIARRTVAKYREELGMLPSNLRRDYK